jgi:hypothetical protein
VQKYPSACAGLVKKPKMLFAENMLIHTGCRKTRIPIAFESAFSIAFEIRVLKGRGFQPRRNCTNITGGFSRCRKLQTFPQPV